MENATESESIRDRALEVQTSWSERWGSMLSAKHKYANRGKLSEHIKSNKRTIYLPVMRSSDTMVVLISRPCATQWKSQKLNSHPSGPIPYEQWLNSPFLHFSGQYYFRTIWKKYSGKIKWTIYHLLSRPAEDNEIQIASEFLNSYSNNDLKSSSSAFTRGLLASNEFIYIE